MTNLAAIKNDDQGTTMVKPARVKPARAFLPEGLREGAMVLTLDGPIPVEHLQDGDRIITRDAGPVELRNIRSRMLQSVRPVMVAVGALGHGNPDEEIIMAPGQRVMLRGAEAMDRFGRDEVIVKVVDLCDGETMQQAAQPMKLRIFLLEFDAEHIVNRQIKSSKGCITTDQIPEGSGLKTLYHNPQFQSFITAVLGEKALYAYADPLSSINVHYAHEGQELGWHFDNSSFAITLLLQAPEGGGVFEYVPDLRDAAAGEMNFQGVADVLEGATPVKTLDMQPGTLVLFRGRNSLHRVTPTAGNRTRLLVVLAYNDAPGVSLSEGARMTFYGRVGT